MAIDTPAKRAQVSSLATLGAIGLFGILPIPDGTIGQADRQHLAGLYGGILASEAAAAKLYRVAAMDFATGGAAEADFSAGGAVAGGFASGGAVEGQGSPYAGDSFVIT